MRLVFEAAPIGIAISGPDSSIRLANPKMAEMLGYARQDLIGRSWRELTHPDDLAASGKPAEKPPRGDAARSAVEKRYLHKSGRTVWAALTARSIVDSSTGERLTLDLVQDITARRRSEELTQSLSEQTAHLDAIIERSPLAVILTNEDREMTYLNSAALEMLGIPEATGAVGQSIRLVDGGPDGESGGMLDDIFSAGHWQGERRFRSLSGRSPIPVHVTAFRLDGERSAVGSMAFVAKDIGQRKQVEAELRDREERLRSLNRQLFRAQERERSRIARDLHDDVTQRLAMAAVEIGFLQAQPEPDAGLLHAKLEAIRRQVVEIADTVRDLSHQYHPSVLSHSNLEGALESLCGEFETLYGIQTRVRSHADTSQAGRGTATAIYRIVQEALQNVARHSGAQQVLLTLNCDDGGDLLRICLIDDGKGFDSKAEHARRGLGLTSMRERAAAIRGTLRIDSEPGEGTRVEITAPIAEGCDDEEGD